MVFGRSEATNYSLASTNNPKITIGLVICGNRSAMALNLIKSLVLFSRGLDLDLRIFHDDVSVRGLRAQLETLQAEKYRQNSTLAYKLYDVWFPSKSWYTLFGKCKAERLFFSDLLPDVERMIYLDIDTLLFSNVHDLWKHFSFMNATQLAAMAPDGLPPGPGTYSFSKIPFYGPRGLNSGVMLLNLERMREIDFPNEVRLIHDAIKGRARFADQDMLNFYFHFHPQLIYVLPCELNYGHQHCDCPHGSPGQCACRGAESEGISVLHGCNRKFVLSPPHFFAEIYTAFAKHDPSKDKLGSLLGKIKQMHQSSGGKNGQCWKLNATIFRKFEKYVLEEETEFASV
jgi:UDP-xylose:glucoside alpha-1,3-xylosyltransferase